PLTALILLILAFGVSLFHLGDPWGSIRSLTNLKLSWLSKEILFFGLYALSLFLDLFLKFNGHGLLWISIGVSLIGMIALFTSAMAYTSPGFPAMNNPVPVVVFFSTASILGIGVLTLLLPSDLSVVLKPYLIGALVCGGLIHLLIPSFWLSGNQVLKSTARAHYGSVLFWIRMVLGFFLPIVFLLFHVKFSLPMVFFLVTGEILGRMIFFNHMVYASENIGRL
ncbi:MAG: dimethyl sulfoxide reductase anchor subunit, partial [Deltaproteobacteria bacterium]|nr:dimethyl sulfoxide reductase anchor subunit [Deltaproteobacteria bacterium]